MPLQARCCRGCARLLWQLPTSVGARGTRGAFATARKKYTMTHTGPRSAASVDTALLRTAAARARVRGGRRIGAGAHTAAGAGSGGGGGGGCGSASSGAAAIVGAMLACTAAGGAALFFFVRGREREDLKSTYQWCLRLPARPPRASAPRLPAPSPRPRGGDTRAVRSRAAQPVSTRILR